jgi:cyclohexadienyl dehydratase
VCNLYSITTNPGVLCAVNPEKPFDVAEKAYWLQRDAALAAFVDRWLQTVRDDGRFKQMYTAWFE